MRIVTFLLLVLTGLAMAVPGIYLATLGGSLYYAIAGIALVASGWLVLRRRPWGLYLFWIVFVATILWSLWEVGFDAWQLMPRLVFLIGAAIWMALLSLTAALGPLSARVRLIGFLLPLAGAVLVALSPFSFHIPADPAFKLAAAAPGNGDWPAYGNTLGGTRYSPLAQITPANVGGLQQAWIYHTTAKTRGGRGGRGGGGLEVTPLMVDNTLYGCTASNAVFALDPVSGKEIWRHEPKGRGAGHAVCRGVTFFRAPAGTAECATRILLGTTDNKLVALDAKTGASCKSFGQDGAVDLNEGLGKFQRGWINPTSPPTIVHGTAVIGDFIVDAQSTKVPSGVIRGYDAVTGAFKWAFDPANPDNHAAPGPGQSYARATPNSWSVSSGDEQLGMVYVPMGNGSPDYYGGYRSANTDRFSSAVVALDADTGAVRWVFQAIHHDLWDYDLAAQPVLVDYPAANGTVPALIQATKTGQVFVLDRRTGKPLLPVTEKPVPVSDIPGEHSSPTQPFSTAMPDFAGASLTEANMWGITPFDQLYCRVKFRQARYEGIYTPLRLGPSVRTPGELGGIDWGSVSVDQGRGILIVNSNKMADYDSLVTRAQADAEHLVVRGSGPRGAANTPRPPPGGAQAGTPYAVHWQAFRDQLGIPCQAPPYGFLTAVDLKSGKILWQHTLGNASNSGPWGLKLGLKLPLGVPNIGGSIVTGGGLVFISATQDQYFRAMDEATGNVVWEERLPAGGHATPMSYQGKDGKQYVLIAAGGNGSFGTASGDDIIAYRLK